MVTRITMDELLDHKDLFHNERVRKAYWGLQGEPAVKNPSSGELWPVDGSLADVAFEMRDACVNTKPSLCHDFAEHVYDQQEHQYSAWWSTTAEQWIRAATLAWESKNG